jgi:hypothetical protein
MLGLSSTCYQSRTQACLLPIVQFIPHILPFKFKYSFLRQGECRRFLVMEKIEIFSFDKEYIVEFFSTLVLVPNDWHK